MEQFCRWTGAWICVAGLVCIISRDALAAGEDVELQQQLRELRQQNETLQRQMRQQQQLIEELTGKVSRIEASEEERRTQQEGTKEADRSAGLLNGKLRIGGEGAVGFFHSQPQGQFPNAEFRVDEAKLFLDASIIDDVYLFGEINLFSRESGSANVRVGELYLDWENVSRLWNKDGQVNLRAGRFDIPFGEEYLTRDAIDNPLISHSVMDLWGVDEGIEAYGRLGKFQYVVALQNGGHDALRDFDSDKAVITRVGFDPARWLHLSVSAMRTGSLDVEGDETSELWLGPGFVRPLGSDETTKFEANLLQGDVHLKFGGTTIKAAGGVLQYDDNDPAGDNRREVYHYYVEAVQKIHRGLYAAARWSQAFAADGFPIPANGDPEKYYEDVLTTKIWQLSLGLGYRWSERLVLKTEYTFTRGEDVSGADRDHEDMLGAQAAFSF